MVKIKAKKRYGQNFLKDKNILGKIIEQSKLTKDDLVLEIGMGTGLLTEELAKVASKVIAIEIDEELFPATQQKLEKYLNVSFIMGDFLQQADNIFAQVDTKLKVIANIPYYITTPIIEKLFSYKEKVSQIVLMVQKEVADRITALPGNKTYGSLSLFVQYYAECRILFNVPPSAFVPAPKVDSAVIELKIRKEPPVKTNEKILFNIIRAAFWGRRKTLANCLKKAPTTHYTNEHLEKIKKETGIDLGRRGETLSLEEYASLANVRFSG